MQRNSKSRVKPQPLIAVRNVRASSRWYRELLNVESSPEHEHRNFYDRISSEGQLVLQLHAWDEHDHANLVNPNAAPVGHGVLLWFEVSDFEATVERARSLQAQIIEEPHLNTRAQHQEMWIRDPDGYVVVLSGPEA